MIWFTENLAEGLVIIGLILLIIEILILGFATFFLFFVGVASILTGAIMYFGMLEATHFNAMISVSISTALLAIFLWKPLKSMQNEVDVENAKNDLMGHEFRCPSDISEEQPGEYHFSGINWKVTSQTPISKGTKVRVIETQVGELEVEPV